MEMDISDMRSKVIERTINIEWLMSSVITQHYLKIVTKEFMLEVLYDEYFSFALKRRILEKIIPDINKQQIQNLNRIGTIRNYFAHCNQQLFFGNSPPSPDGKGSVPDPRQIDRSISFDNLYDEFTGIVGDVENYLANVFRKKGGKLFAYRDNDFVETD